jgi:hypothetical protein
MTITTTSQSASRIKKRCIGADVGSETCHSVCLTYFIAYDHAYGTAIVEMPWRFWC